MRSNSSETHRIVEKPLMEPTHTSMLVREFLVNNKTVIMPQPPYSPDSAPVGYFLFPNLVSSDKRKVYATIEEIKENSKQELLAKSP